jgi:hypothetical protein
MIYIIYCFIFLFRVYSITMNHITINNRAHTGFYMAPSMTTALNTVHNPKGEGVMDIARSIAALAPKVIAGVKSVGNILTGETATALRNMLPDSDENARPGFPGEQHVILKLANGKNGVANYMGPNTNVLARINRGDPGRTAVDSISKAHDLRYALATTLGDIRQADNIMISETAKIAAKKGDSARNLLMAKAITAKKLGEDLGLIRKDAFSGDLDKNKASDADRLVLTAALNKQGFGLQTGYGVTIPGMGLNLPGQGLKLPGQGVKKLMPGDALKLKLIKSMKHKRVKGGFWFLAPLIAVIAEALSTVTVASVGSALATGAATAVGGVVVKKILGDGLKDVMVTLKDIPAKIQKGAEVALSLINKAKNPSPGQILTVVKHLIPHVRRAFLKKAPASMSGDGMTAPVVDKKVLAIVSKML